MKLRIENNEVIMSGEMNIGGNKADVNVKFDEVQQALDFARENNLNLSSDPIVTGYNIGSLAVAVSEEKMDEALVHQGLVFSTDSAWVDSLRKLAEIINHAANELEGKV